MTPQEKDKLRRRLEELPAKRYGIISSNALSDIAEIFTELPELEYPIDSAGALVEKLGGPNASVNIFGIPLSASRLARGMPPNHFPIVSLGNFVEKVARLLFRSRSAVSLLKELGRIRPHLPKFQFPLRNVDDVLLAFESVESIPAISPRLPPSHPQTVAGRKIKEWITLNMRPSLFPIQTEEELYLKAMPLLPGSSHLRS